MRTKRRTSFGALSLAGCFSFSLGFMPIHTTVAVTRTFDGGATFPDTQVDWGAANNWSPNGVPGASDTAIIGLIPGTTTVASVVNGAGQVTNLTLQSGGDLLVNDNMLITNQTTVGGTATNTSVLHIDLIGGTSTDRFTTDLLTVNSDGEIKLTFAGSCPLGCPPTVDGPGLVINDSASINIGGLVRTASSAEFEIVLADDAGLYFNNGTLHVDQGVLTLKDTSPSGTASYDLGGSGSGVVQIDNARELHIETPMTAFDGTMNMESNSVFDSSHAWASTGQITMYDNTLIQGSALTLSNNSILDTIDVIGTGEFANGFIDVTISADLIMEGNAALTVKNSDSLTLQGDAVFNSGTVTFESNADLIIDSGATATFNPNASLTMATSSSAPVLIVEGSMTVNRTAFTGSEIGWTEVGLTGILNLNTDDAGGALVEELNVSGAVSARTITAGVPTKLVVDDAIRLESSTASVTASEIEAGSINFAASSATINASTIHTNSTIVQAGVTSSLDADLHISDKNQASPGVGIRLFGNASLELNGASSLGRNNNPLIASGSELIVNGSLAIDNKTNPTGPGKLVIANSGTVTTGGNLVQITIDIDNSGTLRPVGEIAKSLVIGSATDARTYTQTSTGSLELTITGSDDDVNNFDDIDIFGDVNLAGTLDIDLDNFTPSASISNGDVYEILTWTGSRTGVFDTVLGQLQDPDVMLGLVYMSGSLDIVTRIQGDMDGDGFVGLADLNIVNGHWNQNVDAGVLSQGDTDGDGFIGLNDLNVVLGNWNASAPPSAFTALPEPTSLALLGLGGLAMLRRTRR